jgi:hypothetical protein
MDYCRPVGSCCEIIDRLAYDLELVVPTVCCGISLGAPSSRSRGDAQQPAARTDGHDR